MPLLSPPSTRVLVGRALLAGIAAGLRSMTPLGVLARERNARPIRTGWRNWPVLRSGAGRKILQIAWLGELVGDKLPNTPSRLNPGSFGGRMVMGAVAGMAIGSEGKGAAPRISGAIAGIAGAIAGSFGGFHARTYLTTEVGLPDLPGALVGDTTAYALARQAVKG